MKTIVYILLMLGGSCYAQASKTELKDDLLKNKEVLLAKYFPRAGGKYLYSMYVMPPKHFLKKVEGYKSALNGQYASEKDPALKALMIKDADFSARNVLSWYLEFYGLDSMGVKRFHDLLETKKYTAAQIDSAQKNAYVKQLSEKDRKYLSGMVNDGTSVNDESLFKRSAAYRQWLDNYLIHLSETKYKADTSSGGHFEELLKIKQINLEIRNPFIRTYLNYKATAMILKAVKDNAVKEDAYNNFRALPGNTAYLEEIRQIYANYKRMNGKGLAPDFTYADADGKMVSLKSLRGKYVYIDVWATWCSPCKAEIPFLKKLEQEFHHKNIYFVSLSVDKMADHGKWMDYVNQHQLGGIQLISDKDFKADFVKQFNISGIPRFILIDPEGRIVSGDARRPSDPELRKELDQLLK
ncbi:TlpA family protein disulfide reductase [Pedobacter africanus]|uniref:Thiol-disulfide isomerase or thioredoxin n=1 Tax=Pedobacter africanus TaxID=151894 RepID=A0A1W2DWS4_9SPHI|nr:TlpA disulfide reductase family protein [Pedobacter africanus]SMD01873.1 Thiol-disulfide isomerase or thioredoxin [Pedobacter africanus]